MNYLKRNFFYFFFWGGGKVANAMMNRMFFIKKSITGRINKITGFFYSYFSLFKPSNVIILYLIELESFLKFYTVLISNCHFLTWKTKNYRWTLHTYLTQLD